LVEIFFLGVEIECETEINTKKNEEEMIRVGGEEEVFEVHF